MSRTKKTGHGSISLLIAAGCVFPVGPLLRSHSTRAGEPGHWPIPGVPHFFCDVSCYGLRGGSLRNSFTLHCFGRAHRRKLEFANR